MIHSLLGLIALIATGWLVAILLLQADKHRLLAKLPGQRTRAGQPLPVREDPVRRIPALPAPGSAQPHDQPSVVDDLQDEDQDPAQGETPDTAFSVDLGLQLHAPATTRSMTHVSVRIYARLEPGRGHRGDLVIERRTVTIPEEAAGERYEALKDAAAEALVDAVLDPTWPTVTEFWVTPVGDNVASLAEGVQADADAFHDLLVGQPIESIGSAVGIPAMPLTVASAVGVKLPLPGDPTIKTAKLVLLSIGIIAFSLAGAPILANACLKVLIHDQVAQLLTTAVKQGFSAALEFSEPTDLSTPEGVLAASRPLSDASPQSFFSDPFFGSWAPSDSSDLEEPMVGSEVDLDDELEVEVAPSRPDRSYRPGARLSRNDWEVTAEEVFGPERKNQRRNTREYETGPDVGSGW